MANAPRPSALPKLGPQVLMILVWLVLEYSRPPNPMKVPYLISLALLAGWLLHKHKLWNPQIVMMLLFLGQMILMIPFSENNYSARMTTREVLTVILCIAIPMAHFIDSLRRFEAVMWTWIGVFVYMGIVAVLNGGNGPGGAAHGVDENYTACFMSVAISYAFFATLAVRNPALKVALFGAAALFVVAIVMGMSRGGFLGLVGVAAYCWWRSPQKLPSLAGAVVAVLLFLFLVPESYMQEVSTIGDTSESTAQARITFWRIATQIWMDLPVFGAGPGNFPWMIPYYQTVNAQGTALGMHVTHSLYFELLAEMGTTGVLLWGGILFTSIRDLRLVARVSARARRASRPRKGRRLSARERLHLRRLRNADAWSRALTSAFIGFLVCSLFLSTLYYTTFWLLTAMTLALREATLREARALRAERRRRAPAPAESAPEPPAEPVLAPLPASQSSLVGR